MNDKHPDTHESLLQPFELFHQVEILRHLMRRCEGDISHTVFLVRIFVNQLFDKFLVDIEEESRPPTERHIQ